jgi:hypothetical protein
MLTRMSKLARHHFVTVDVGMYERLRSARKNAAASLRPMEAPNIRKAIFRLAPFIPLTPHMHDWIVVNF